MRYFSIMLLMFITSFVEARELKKHPFIYTEPPVMDNMSMEVLESEIPTDSQKPEWEQPKPILNKQNIATPIETTTSLSPIEYVSDHSDLANPENETKHKLIEAQKMKKKKPEL